MGRKTIILVAQFLTLAGYLLQALAPSLLWIFISRIISGSGGGALGAVQSYIADVTKEDQRDMAYSLYGAVFGAAFIVGPAASGFLIHRSLAVPFLVAAGNRGGHHSHHGCITSIADAAQEFDEHCGVAPSGERSRRSARSRASLSRDLCDRLFSRELALYLHHVLDSPTSQVGSLLSAAGVVGGAALVFVVTPLARRLGDRRVAQIGLFVSFLAYGMLDLRQGLEHSLSYS